jgi:hypothetical protein
MITVHKFEKAFGIDSCYDWPQVDGDDETEVGLSARTFQGREYFQISNPHDGDYDGVFDTLEGAMEVFNQEVDRVSNII